MNSYSNEAHPVSQQTARLRYSIFGICAALYLAAVGYSIWFAIQNAARDPFAGFLLVLLTFPTSMAVTVLLNPFAPEHNAGATFWAPIGGLCALAHVWVAYLLVRHFLRPKRSA